MKKNNLILELDKIGVLAKNAQKVLALSEQSNVIDSKELLLFFLIKFFI